MTPENYWVYVLRNPAGKYYIGISSDVDRRLTEHNAGYSTFTSKHRPWEIAWRRGPMSLSDARKLENWLKRQKGGIGFRSETGL